MLTTLVAPSGIMTLQKAAMLGLAWTGSSAHRWRRFSSETEGVRRAWWFGHDEDNGHYNDKVCNYGHVYYNYDNNDDDHVFHL